MKRIPRVYFWFVLLSPALLGAAKQHVVGWGKWSTVQWRVGSDESKIVQLKIRPLIVDGRVKEFVVGPSHDMTEQTFVAQRAYRLNDSLPQESGATRWRWERGGWVVADRVTGKVQSIALPLFDPYSSTLSWYRDYAAYCGVSDDGKKLFAIVWQLGKRKPLLKKPIGDPSDTDMPDGQCPAPLWQRGPVRVTFETPHDQKFTYTVRSHAVEIVSEDDDDTE